MYQRDYRTATNSPTGTIADSDVFTFDKASRMLTAISGRYSNTVTYVYDPAGRKASESLTIAGQTYTTGLGYSQRGELSKYTYPDGAVVDRLYTARGELYQVKHNTTVMDTRAYDDGGRLASSTLGNGVVETRGYNSDHTLSTISFGGSGTAIGNLTYSWDSNKNKTSETIGGVMSPYSFTQAGTTYDAEDRLTGFARAATSGTPQLSQSWNLSAVGDWNSVTTNGTAQSRTHGPTHELVTAGGQSVTHDTKGNMLLIPASVRANSSPLVLTWDFDNRMVSADVGADSVIDVTHQYDALGRRVARTASGSTTVFVQVDQQTICDYASGAAPASSTYRYLYGSYIDEPIVRIATSNSETTWYHRNQQYSIVACTDSTGAATERYAYTAYGLPTIADGSGTVRTSTAIGNRYTYTGREWDGVLGLYHYRARMYEATVGRFCSRDPIGYEDGNSIYQYCSNEPLNFTDPSGYNKCKIKSANAFQIEFHCGEFPEDQLGRVGFSFKSEFEFENGCGGCACCSYRQYVYIWRVEVILTSRSGRTRSKVYRDENGHGFEDCREKVDSSGNKYIECYGHRGDHESDGNRYSNDGCRYEMRDSPAFEVIDYMQKLEAANPGISNSITKIRVVQTWRFVANVTDTCEGPNAIIWSQVLDYHCDRTIEFP